MIFPKIQPEKGRILVKSAIFFVSDANKHDSSKDKSKLIEVMGRYIPANKDIKANNYQVNIGKFNY